MGHHQLEEVEHMKESMDLLKSKMKVQTMETIATATIITKTKIVPMKGTKLSTSIVHKNFCSRTTRTILIHLLLLLPIRQTKITKSSKEFWTHYLFICLFIS